MTRTEARQTLDIYDGAIADNVEDYRAGRISYAEFRRLQRVYHDEIAAAGQTGHFCRRWRAANPC
jgi:hypothetical protein